MAEWISVTDRERLVELLEELEQEKALLPDETAADYLISHGVAVQKHGRWVFHESEYLDYVECSECHEDFVSCDEDCAVTNYCPNCGAKMDGEADDT